MAIPADLGGALSAAAQGEPWALAVLGLGALLALALPVLAIRGLCGGKPAAGPKKAQGNKKKKGSKETEERPKATNSGASVGEAAAGEGPALTKKQAKAKEAADALAAKKAEQARRKAQSKATQEKNAAPGGGKAANASGKRTVPPVVTEKNGKIGESEAKEMFEKAQSRLKKKDAAPTTSSGGRFAALDDD
eukprot:CAMPEP_0197898338 /NCGR_PEP_ID=MMETSP1439-20131203/43785_1 /TAXON_ID=66791 /ORGANISM="Gonyaulax spinifera, Strain CCMP409" /LENGTH=191 /DNA_ID=CAMNT_0043519045 /DNA_START=74 /DNA_END=649 /DNA_ORIENTATION=+